jgi:hypothetical protein
VKLKLGQLKTILDALDPDNNVNEVMAALNTLKAASKGLWLSDYIETMFTNDGDESAVDRRVDEQRRIDKSCPI